MQSDFQQFIDSINLVNKIEVAKDYNFPDGIKILIQGDQMGISQTLFAILTKYSIQHIQDDPVNASLIGVLLGTYNDRVWNVRKNLSIPILEELHYTHLGITANPKSEYPFIYLRYLIKDCQNQELIQKEFNFINSIDYLRLRNSYLWRHRVWFTETFHKQNEAISWVTQYLQSHPADFSAYSFLQHFTTKDYNSIVKLFQQNTINIFYYPGHESLWYHRRFLLKELKLESNSEQINFEENAFLKPLTSNHALNQLYHQICDIFDIDISEFYKRDSSSEKQLELKLENEDLIFLAAISETFATEAQAQIHCATQHLKWLRDVYPKLINV